MTTPLTGKGYFPNALEFMGKIYYVAQNHPKACDGNPGTKNLPFKTIAKAASIADMGDVVIIARGTYREEVPLVRNGHQYQPWSMITFKAVPGQKVYLKGSDVFEPDWQSLGGGVFKAKLPDPLFQKGAYNPYALSGVIDDPKTVRPVDGPALPETLGQLYVDGKALEQLTTLQAVQKTPGSFVVAPDGREIIVHFPGGKVPKGKLVELTVRERCFKPTFPGAVFIQTMGMVVEHAANPGPFCLCRPLTMRRNGATGIIIRKTFALRSSVKLCNILCPPSYKGKKDPAIIASAVDLTGPGRFDDAPIRTLESRNGGKTWKITDPGTIRTSQQWAPAYFLDEEHDRLVKYYLRYSNMNLNEFGLRNYEIVTQISADRGKTWTEPVRAIAANNCDQINKLQDGRLLWIYTEPEERDFYHARIRTLLGKWRPDLSGIDWEEGGILQVDPKESSAGLDEPQACQLPDGRIFILIRQGNILPAQDHPGTPSVKLFTVSDDAGRSWAPARPLTYEDGRFIYSPRSMPGAFRSVKNGRVYVILNIAPGSAHNCDPRTTLHIAELDTNPLCVKKDTVAVIETKHEEHHFFVRFSNWSSMQDRYTGNLLLFMQLSMCEYCFVRKGYDFNCYRYEIEVPD